MFLTKKPSIFKNIDIKNVDKYYLILSLRATYKTYLRNYILILRNKLFEDNVYDKVLLFNITEPIVIEVDNEVKELGISRIEVMDKEFVVFRVVYSQDALTKDYRYVYKYFTEFNANLSYENIDTDININVLEHFMDYTNYLGTFNYETYLFFGRPLGINFDMYTKINLLELDQMVIELSKDTFYMFGRYYMDNILAVSDISIICVNVKDFITSLEDLCDNRNDHIIYYVGGVTDYSLLMTVIMLLKNIPNYGHFNILFGGDWRWLGLERRMILKSKLTGLIEKDIYIDFSR